MVGCRLQLARLAVARLVRRPKLLTRLLNHSIVVNSFEGRGNNSSQKYQCPNSVDETVRHLHVE